MAKTVYLSEQLVPDRANRFASRSLPIDEEIP